MGAVSLPITPATDSVKQMVDATLRVANQGNYTRASALFCDVLKLDPDNVMALLNLGAIRCHTGQFSEGVDLLRRAHQLAPDNDHARSNYRGACGMDADAKRAAGDYIGALPRLREMLDLDPADTAVRINLIDALFRSGQRSVLSDFAPDLTDKNLGKKLFVACMPKSGSSWLLNTLTTMTGFSRSAYVFAFLQNEQELYLPDMIASARTDAVIQQHCRATAGNVQLMQAFSIRPTVLIRNLFDTLLSLTDFYANGATVNTFFRRDFDSLERASQIDLVIDHYAPWYLQFVASWLIAEEEESLDFTWISYEDMMADKKTTIARLSDYYDLGKTDTEIMATLARVEGDKSKNRFNKGVAGRGEQELTTEQKDRVRRLASYFNSIPFDRIGL